MTTLEQKEILHFYSDYPHRDSLLVWYRLHEYLPNSPESIEARWRIARDSAGRERFEQADKLLAEAGASLIGPGELELFDPATTQWASAKKASVEMMLPPGGGKLVRVAR